MLGGSKASALAHAACLPTRDASLPLSITRERVFFTACHEEVAATCHAERHTLDNLRHSMLFFYQINMHIFA